MLFWYALILIWKVYFLPRRELNYAGIELPSIGFGRTIEMDNPLVRAKG